MCVCVCVVGPAEVSTKRVSLRRYVLPLKLRSRTVPEQYRYNLAMKTIAEVWSPVAVKGHRLEVSDLGRVRELDGTLLSPRKARDGYPVVHGIKLHRLVLEAFVGPRPRGQMCCHADDNPDNNRLDNLRWGTSRENQQDRIRNHSTGKAFVSVERQEKAREITLRRAAARRGMRVERSRMRDPQGLGYGLYRIVDAATGEVLAGSGPGGFTLTLEQVQSWLGWQPPTGQQ